MREVKPPTIPDIERRVFLAGSIDMGAATDWQADLVRDLADVDNLILLNPRRDEWDSSWEQKKSNPEFYGQVSWELIGLESSDIIALYLGAGTVSPISLLELGLFAREGKLVVCCEEGFWRKGNVDIVCEKYGIPLLETYDELLWYLRVQLGVALPIRSVEEKP